MVKMPTAKPALPLLQDAPRTPPVHTLTKPENPAPHPSSLKHVSMVRMPTAKPALPLLKNVSMVRILPQVQPALPLLQHVSMVKMPTAKPALPLLQDAPRTPPVHTLPKPENPAPHPSSLKHVSMVKMLTA